jgi:hypothetical protein
VAVDVGDAILRFIGDTQNLDLAFDTVGAQAETKLAPVNAQLTQVSSNWDLAGTSATAAGAEAEVAGEEMSAAARLTAREMREAKGEIALLGEEIGIRLPRHLRSFVAELPGVGEALNAAFSATAVLLLIQLLAEGVTKLTDWVSSTLIFTEEMKKSNAEIAAANVLLVAQKDAFEKAKAAIDDFGKSGVELAGEKVEKLTASLADQQHQLDEAKSTIAAYRLGIEGVTEAQKLQAENSITLLSVTIKSINEQLEAAQLAQQKAEFDAYIRQQQALAAAQKTAGDARAAYQLAQGEVTLALQTNNYEALASLRARFDEQEYQDGLTLLQRKLTLAKEDPKNNISQIIELNAQIEAEEQKHNAKTVTAYAELLTTLKNLRAASLDALQTSGIASDFSDDLTKNVQKAEQAAAALGFTFTGDLAQGLENAKKAFDDLKASGQASQSDLLQGNIRLLQSQIAYDREFGQSTAASEKQLQTLQAEYAKLTGAEDKFQVHSRGLWSQFQRDLKAGATVMDEVKQSGVQAFDSLSQGIESAIASAILSQQSFGAAIEKATAQALASLASQALVKALFYTAEGFASEFTNPPAAAGFFTAAGIMAAIGGAAAGAAYGLNGAGGSGSRSAAGGGSGVGSPIATSPAGTTHNEPIVGQNVQRFAGGGLISQPTLAVVGDSKSGGSSREGVLPLDDPQAMNQIADAIASRLPQSSGGVHVHVKGMISPDNLAKVTQQINRKVNNGQLSLHSSSTGRITKRSA